MSELWAPRPRRINVPYPRLAQQSPVARAVSPSVGAFARVRCSDQDAQVASSQPSDNDSSPPPSAGRNSSSPLLNLPSDALEEFFSILRPALFPPASPTFRGRYHDTGSTFLNQLERPHALSHRSRDSLQLKSPLAVSNVVDEEEVGSGVRITTPTKEIQLTSDGDQPAGNMWRFSNLLESPVSRTHTRNPFQRHASYEITSQPSVSTQLSPALLPLPPSPSPSSMNLSPSASTFDSNVTDD